MRWREIFCTGLVSFIVASTMGYCLVGTPFFRPGVMRSHAEWAPMSIPDIPSLMCRRQQHFDMFQIISSQTLFDEERTLPEEFQGPMRDTTGSANYGYGLALKGIIRFGLDYRAVVYLPDTGLRTLKTGDVISGWEIVRVFERSVLVRDPSGRQLEIEIETHLPVVYVNT